MTGSCTHVSECFFLRGPRQGHVACAQVVLQIALEDP